MAFPDPEFMRLALRLARKGIPRTSPNPAVGAVLVRGGQVVGAGYHRAPGMPHAEVEAIRAAGSAARRADLYVTLEPCAHTGRTGPCTDAILRAGIRRVAAAMEDPNPKVRGRGFRALSGAGIPVHIGILAPEARVLNERYCRWVVTGRPFVTLKLALSLDGQIALASGTSRWITGETARKCVHRMRAIVDAILVGGKTFRADDPLLTARSPGARNPRRVVLTSDLSRAMKSRLLRAGVRGTIFVCPRGADGAGADRLREAGAKVLLLPSRNGRIDAGVFLAALGREGITSLLVEGGGETAGWLTAAGAVDRYVFFVAPLLLGEGIRAVSGFSAAALEKGRRLVFTSVRRVGEDLMVTAEPARNPGKRPG
jgi:diaminohydroxyphosphoribosylaminopyrimidine deaminase / 5-amino-6-(5-phosphoribosylamino)uracil reductase